MKKLISHLIAKEIVVTLKLLGLSILGTAIFTGIYYVATEGDERYYDRITSMEQVMDSNFIANQHYYDVIEKMLICLIWLPILIIAGRWLIILSTKAYKWVIANYK